MKFLCCFLIAATASAVAQRALTESQIVDALRSGTSEQRQSALASIGVENAAEYADFHASMAGEIKWLKPRLVDSNNIALLFLPCHGDGSFLFLVRENEVGNWKATDWESFDCHYDDSVSIKLSPLRDAKVDDILIEHDCDEHGSGFVSHNAHVYSIQGHKLVLLLTSQDKLFQEGWNGGRDEDRSSVFLPVPRKHGIFALEETKVRRVSDSSEVMRRYFYWSRMSHSFRHTAFKTVSFSLPLTARESAFSPSP
jgi:hypothetical protein